MSGRAAIWRRHREVETFARPSAARFPKLLGKHNNLFWRKPCWRSIVGRHLLVIFPLTDIKFCLSLVISKETLSV
jgi:hypothetical protein